MLIALVLSACSITPIAPIPRPLPETLEFAARDAGAGGAFLGLRTRENMAGGFDELEFRPGIQVVRVVENSPAAEAGLRAGDIVLHFNGVPTDDPETLDILVQASAPGLTLELEVQRGDSSFQVPVTLGAPVGSAPVEVALNYRLDPSRSRAAWLSGREGVVLVASHPEAPFPRAGIAVGSVVTELDGQAMHSDRALIRNLQAREPGSRVSVNYLDAEGEAHHREVRLQAQPRRLTEFSIPILGTYRASPDGQSASLVVLDLWFISLFRYSREGTERSLSVLRFLSFQSGIGELNE